MAGILIRKINSFYSIPVATKWLFVESLITSAYVKCALLFLPFRVVAGWLGQGSAGHVEAGARAEDLWIEKVKNAVRLCDKYAPWPTECYTRSLTAKIMLRRRKVASTLFFGFGRDPGGELKGHAWLKSSGRVVTGFCDFSKYEVHSSFS